MCHLSPARLVWVRFVGPNLAGLNNRAPATYLTAILDPNQAVEAKWMMFVAKTKAGLTLAGSVAEETSSAITLVGVDGSRTKISRSELQSLESTGRSLMPEGLETAINPSEMSDLLTYLRSTGRPLKQAIVKGNTVEHLNADHDGFYSISFDPVPGATGIELEWNNEGNFKHFGPSVKLKPMLTLIVWSISSQEMFFLVRSVRWITSLPMPLTGTLKHGPTKHNPTPTGLLNGLFSTLSLVVTI